MNFIKVMRGWQDSEVFQNEPYSEREAWLWMIGEANFKDKKINIDSKPYVLKRGQFRSSIRFMADKFQWSKDRVVRFTDKLANWGMIATDIATGQTIITICNYLKYQDGKDSGKDDNKDTSATVAGHLPDSTKDKLEEGSKKDQEGKEQEEGAQKISIEMLSVEHIREWLTAKRVQGKYLTVDEDRLLEKFKDYCRAKGPKYKDLIAAFRNSFEWDNAPKKGQENGTHQQKLTKADRARNALDLAEAELNGMELAAAETGGPELSDIQRLRQGTGGAAFNPARLRLDTG